MRRKHLALVLAAVLLLQLGLSGPVLAADTYPSPEDPVYMSRGEMQAAQLASVPSDYSEAVTRTLQSGEVLRKGIDVSVYQGDIDWAKVKAAGVEFAFIRAGYKGWGSGLLNDDSKMVRNIEGALANGIQVGAYVFSQARTEAEAREEARYLVERVKGYNITLPLVIDYEFGWSSGSSAGLLYEAYQDGSLTREKAAAACLAFCDEVEKAGYTGIVYANPTMLKNYLVPGKLGPVWLAHYTTQTDYTGDYTFWQFSDCGSIDGISGDVDLDFWFEGSGKTGVEPDPPAFADVPAGSWYEKAVSWAVENGVTTGKTATTFAPGGGCTRAEAVTFLWRAAGVPEPAGTKNPFTDVSSTSYYYKAVLWAVEQEITAGQTPAAFAPNAPCTRAQIVTFLWRAAGAPEPTGTKNPFTDVSSSAYYYKAMLWAVEQGIAEGTGNGKFSPNAPCTRAQTVTFLWRDLGQ